MINILVCRIRIHTYILNYYIIFKIVCMIIFFFFTIHTKLIGLTFASHLRKKLIKKTNFFNYYLYILKIFAFTYF